MSANGTVSHRLGRAVGALLFDSRPARRALRRSRERLLERAYARGLTPALRPPLTVLSTGELDPDGRRDAERIERLRADLASDRRTGAASAAGRRVPLRRLALVASVDPLFGAFLNACARAIGARGVIELGACVGIGTSYLAAAGAERVVSIEASAERAEIARATAARVSDRAEVIVGRFDDVLSSAVARFDAGLDMAWIDGHHEREATLRNFEAISPALNEGAVVAFDDIRYSPGMWRAWRELEAADGFADTVDLGPIGIGVWSRRGVRPRVHDLRGAYGRPRSLHLAADAASAAASISRRWRRRRQGEASGRR